MLCVYSSLGSPVRQRRNPVRMVCYSNSVNCKWGIEAWPNGIITHVMSTGIKCLGFAIIPHLKSVKSPRLNFVFPLLVVLMLLIPKPMAHLCWLISGDHYHHLSFHNGIQCVCIWIHLTLFSYGWCVEITDCNCVTGFVVYLKINTVVHTNVRRTRNTQPIQCFIDRIMRK